MSLHEFNACNMKKLHFYNSWILQTGSPFFSLYSFVFLKKKLHLLQFGSMQ
jgi:hypothetical protein